MTPTHIQLHQKSRVLEVHFGESVYQLPCEYLRVHSPSAEVRGHGNEEPKLVLNKSDVNIKAITPAGHYAIKIVFDDGHDSGIYTWELLQTLGENYAENWENYQQRVATASSGVQKFTPM